MSKQPHCNIPHGNIPYVNNQNTVPAPKPWAHPNPKEGKLLKRKEEEAVYLKRIDSIMLYSPKPGHMKHNDAFKIFPAGWWKCTWKDCPKGAHGLGVKKCPILYSPGRVLEDGQIEGQRDPIEKKEGWWCCPGAPECRCRRPLYKAERFCACEVNRGRDALIEASACEDPPEILSWSSIEQSVGNAPETMDVLEEGLECGVGEHGVLKLEQPRPKPKPWLRLRGDLRRVLSMGLGNMGFSN